MNETSDISAVICTHNRAPEWVCITVEGTSDNAIWLNPRRLMAQGPVDDVGQQDTVHIKKNPGLLTGSARKAW